MESCGPTTDPDEAELDARPAVFPLGTLLGGKYELRSVLGRGAMGQVFEAYDLRLRRRVAVKAHWKNVPLSVEHEARALAAVRHPSVVAVHDLGEHEGVLYLVMEFVSGTPWSKHLERLRRQGTQATVDETLGILRAIAGGLAALHDAGVAHGDVKPANVLLSAQHVMLTDLGLVRVEATPERLAGFVAGTPAYVSPELVLGETRVGNAHLVDIYAFGVTAFEALIGRTPYDGEHAMQIFAQHVDAPVPRVAEERVDVPIALSALVSECMAKDPHERPSTMRDVLWRLEGVRSRLVRRDPLEVLVVDDDEDIARLLVAGVREANPGAVVRTARDGTSAIASFQQHRPHVLLLDMMMPGMSGLEVFGYLRGAGLLGDCDVLFVSAAGGEAEGELVTSLGARCFVQKGEGLRRRVRDLVRTLLASPSQLPTASLAPPQRAP